MSNTTGETCEAGSDHLSKFQRPPAWFSCVCVAQCLVFNVDNECLIYQLVVSNKENYAILLTSDFI